ncbi:MAG TPA: adenine deaminase [Caldilineaceae bacterium]|nr:adenine deaminase [Caldilineaceae bacterium]
MTLPDLLAVARGDRPADLALRNCRIVNVFSGAIEEGDIALAGDRIAGIGQGYRAAETVDVGGAVVTPGLIDAHVHIESSLCIPAQFAAGVLPRGVTCAVTDPHEIANVAGLAGIRYMAKAARDLPLTVLIMASSCVPATHMESTGATLAADDLADLLAEGTVIGLAEVMNYPGVIQGDPGVLGKIAAFRGHPVDGHLPKVRGRALNAYVAAGIGSEHECTTVEEAAEKLARGLYILIREATNARNLHALLPLINRHNCRRICFCTDDRTPGDLLEQGSIDYMVREAIAYGIEPVEAIRMATLNPAEWFGLRDRGAVAPGRVADLVVVDDLHDFRPRLVFARGKLVAQEGSLLPTVALTTPGDAMNSTVRVDWSAVNFRVPVRGDRLRAIGAVEGQIVTEERIVETAVHDGLAVADPARDLLKIAVIERHQARGAMGHGFIQGIGLRQGAIAGSVAHDHHNLMVIGADDRSMLTAARAVAEMGGGLVVAHHEQVIADLPLPIGGLMSDRPIREVAGGYARVLAAASAQGSPLHDPFMAMSFMGLEVIPKLKLTDQGLVDVEQFRFVDLFVK